MRSVSRNRIFLAVVLTAAAIVVAPRMGAVLAQGPGNPGGPGNPDPGPPVSIPQPVDVYSVKFVCGSYSGFYNNHIEGPVKPGNYQTAINLHNPNGGFIAFRKKAIVMFQSDKPPTAPELPVRPFPFINKELAPNWGMEIDCDDIYKVLAVNPGPPPNQAITPGAFAKGWVIIEVPGNIFAAPRPFDVTAVYTGHGYGVANAGSQPPPEGFALDVESIVPKRVSK